MSGHLCFPLVTGDGMPASLSPYFMTTLLRGRIGFKGLAVTDDLAMNGAGNAAGSISEACVKAIEAGNDLLMISKLIKVGRSGMERASSSIPRQARLQGAGPRGGREGHRDQAEVPEAAWEGGSRARRRGPRGEGPRSRGRGLLRGPSL